MKNVQIIEKTAKRYKAMGLLSKVLIFGAMAVPLFGQPVVWPILPISIAAVVFTAGVVLAVYVRIGIWWNHS